MNNLNFSNPSSQLVASNYDQVNVIQKQILITSTIEEINSGNIYKHYNTQQQFTYDNIKLRLDTLLYWLNSDVIPPIYFILNEVKEFDVKAIQDCQVKVKKIEEKLQELYKFFKLFKSSRRKQQYKFTCSSCQQIIPRQSTANDNFWSILQEHAHIEDGLFRTYNGAGIMDNRQLSRSSNKVRKYITIPKNLMLESNPVINARDISTETATNNECCERCGSESSKGFKFCFPICYDPLIEQVFYTNNGSALLPKCEIDGLPTIQIKGPHLFACLLCATDVGTSVASRALTEHNKGQKHTKKKLCDISKNALLMYHINWLKLEPNYQAHQTFFLPCTSSTVLCSLCGSLVNYSSLQEHIDNPTHRDAFFKIAQRGTKLYLTTLQATVYATPNNINDSKPNKNETMPRSNYRILANIDKEQSVSDDSDEYENSTKNNQGTNEKFQNNSKSDNGTADKFGKNQAKNNHVIIKSISYPNATNLQDLLEHRFVLHLDCVMKIRDDVVDCNSCNIKMPKEASAIKEHIISDKHTSRAGIHLIKYCFYCEICNSTHKNEKQWMNHLESPAHVDRHNSLGTTRKNRLTEYECKSCKLVIFGDELSIKRHLASSRNSRSSRSREPVLPEQVKTLFKSEQIINEQTAKLVAEAKAVVINQEPMLICCLALENALSEVLGNCKAYPFGSRVSGLGNKDSDLDVFIDIGNMYTGFKNQDAKMQEKFVKTATKVFRMKRGEFDHVNPIPTARTPIVQVLHIKSDIDCDVSFRHGLSVENTKFLRMCIDLQPIVQALILILKGWIMKCKLHENITTYALAMMVIFFLQIKGHLISVQELKQLYLGRLLDIDGWKVPDFSNPPSVNDLRITPFTGTLKQIMLEFFTYYRDFNYSTDVICPLIGRPIKKSLFSEKPQGEALPLEMLTYVQKINANPTMEYFRSLSPLCIQDPFDLSHNLTKACSQNVVDKFKAMCRLTISYLHTIR